MLQPNHKTIIITMQNGIGNLEVIKDVIESSDIGKLAQPTIIQAVTDQGAMMLGPGYVKHTGHGIITFARSKDEEVNKQVLSLFQSSGQEVEINENIESVQWGKLVINAGINPVTALYNLENGQLVHNEKGRSMLRKLINEAVAVAIAKGITLSYGTTSEQAIAKAETILRNTSQNKSSMLTDILRGVATEIHSINGVVVAEGDKLGVDVRFNRSMLAILDSLYRVNVDSEYENTQSEEGEKIFL